MIHKLVLGLFLSILIGNAVIEAKTLKIYCENGYEEGDFKNEWKIASIGMKDFKIEDTDEQKDLGKFYYTTKLKTYTEKCEIGKNPFTINRRNELNKLAQECKMGYIISSSVESIGYENEWSWNNKTDYEINEINKKRLKNITLKIEDVILTESAIIYNDEFVANCKTIEFD